MNKSYKKHLKQNFCNEVQKEIIKNHPELTGKFTFLNLWIEIEYLYSQHHTIQNTVNIISKIALKRINCNE